MTQTIDASPARVNVKGLVLGDSLVRSITVRNIDLSAATFAAKVRLSDGTTKAFTVSGLAYDGTDTTLTITLAPADSEDLAVGYAHPWDVQYTLAGAVTTIIRGMIRVHQQVT